MREHKRGIKKICRCASQSIHGGGGKRASNAGLHAALAASSVERIFNCSVVGS